MIIERDVPIPMEDGLVLRADVFRPPSGGPHPVVMTLGPYAKGVREFQPSLKDYVCIVLNVMVVSTSRSIG